MAMEVYVSRGRPGVVRFVIDEGDGGIVEWDKRYAEVRELPDGFDTGGDGTEGPWDRVSLPDYCSDFEW